MPYMSCPSCRRTHYEPPTLIVTKRSCPRCLRKHGIDSPLIESATLAEARAALGEIPPGPRLMPPAPPAPPGQAATAT
jgi:hypothetical protein